RLDPSQPLYTDLEEIRKDSLAIAELMSSVEKLEKYGRERYLMKKDDEEIFLVVRRKASAD
ncbi:MAG TPA: hypothetical protein P5550_04140, partial [Bacteroidales bacterium]|nr:hypothetical protein [Bacteroidales bacterium]